MTYLYFIPWALIPVLIVIGCIRAKPDQSPAVDADSPVLETPAQGGGSNSIDKENA